jgi:hypothetical protein
MCYVDLIAFVQLNGCGHEIDTITRVLVAVNR